MIKVLIVASGNSGKLSPFIQDQIDALEKEGIIIFKFLIKGKGFRGYLNNYRSLIRSIKHNKPDIIHAHYGLSGLLSVLQMNIPVVLTFHGSDINDQRVKYFSIFASKLSAESIFVSEDLAKSIKYKKPEIIPCGVELDVFYPIDKIEARRELGLLLDKKYILFSSSFSKPVKNLSLAKEAISKLPYANVELIELAGFTRSKVALLMNAVDIALLTSFTEGSPQFIKEAMACNTPIVSTDVGDVRDVIGKTEGCFITTFDPEDVAEKIKSAFEFGNRTAGRNNISHFEASIIAKKIIKVYKSVLKK